MGCLLLAWFALKSVAWVLLTYYPSNFKEVRLPFTTGFAIGCQSVSATTQRKKDRELKLCCVFTPNEGLIHQNCSVSEWVPGIWRFIFCFQNRTTSGRFVPLILYEVSIHSCSGVEVLPSCTTGSYDPDASLRLFHPCTWVHLRWVERNSIPANGTFSKSWIHFRNSPSWIAIKKKHRAEQTIYWRIYLFNHQISILPFTPQMGVPKAAQEGQWSNGVEETNHLTLSKGKKISSEIILAGRDLLPR